MNDFIPSIRIILDETKPDGYVKPVNDGWEIIVSTDVYHMLMLYSLRKKVEEYNSRCENWGCLK